MSDLISIPRPADEARASSLRLRAFTEGAAALNAGLPAAANAYPPGPDRDRWAAGWTAALNVRDGELADIAAEIAADARRCRVCGCTDADCGGCVARTGQPCYWIDADLCSACATPRMVPVLAGATPNCPSCGAPMVLAENPADDRCLRCARHGGYLSERDYEYEIWGSHGRP